MRCRRPAGTSLATRMGRSRLGQGLARTGGVADLGSPGRVQGLVLLEVGELEQALRAAADPIDQPRAGRLGTDVAAQQLQVLLLVGAELLAGGSVARPYGGPGGMGGADLLVVLVPLGSVAAGELRQCPAAGLVPDLGSGGAGGQLQAGLLPVALVLVGVAAGQLAQRPVAAGGVAAAVLPLAAAGLALGGTPGASLGVKVEQLHPLGLAAVAAHLGQHHQHLQAGGTPYASVSASSRSRKPSAQQGCSAAGTGISQCVATSSCSRPSRWWLVAAPPSRSSSPVGSPGRGVGQGRR